MINKGQGERDKKCQDLHDFAFAAETVVPKESTQTLCIPRRQEVERNRNIVGRTIILHHIPMRRILAALIRFRSQNGSDHRP